MKIRQIDWYNVDVICAESKRGFDYTDNPLEIGYLNIFFNCNFVGYFFELVENAYVTLFGIDEENNPFLVTRRQND